MNSHRRGCIVIAIAWLAGSAQSVSAQSGTLALNESKTVTVRANQPFNYSHIRLVKDQRYRFTVTSPAWNNGTQVTDAGGYDDQVYPIPPLPVVSLKRYSDYRRMELIAEIYAQDENPSSERLTHFRIGLGREWTAARSGFLVTGPNDCATSSPTLAAVSIPCYADNSRVVTLTVTRIQ